MLKFINMHPKLIHDIQREKDTLIKFISNISPTSLLEIQIDGIGGKISIFDLIAYQIGWGKSLIRWYEAGIQGETPDMPGDGFLKWDYKAIAKHFYQKYQYNSLNEQIFVFQEVVSLIIEIILVENQTGRLEQVGVWSWCTLPSGKKWPLSKWIRVNTASPYKRAS